MQVKHAKDQPEQTEGHKTLVKLNEQIQKQVINKVRNVHAIVKHNRPISDFIWLNDLDKSKGFDYGQVYHNQSAATQLLESIANVERNKLKDLLPKVIFFSIIMDGNTDDASIEQESFFRSCINGKIISKFICIGEPESTSSDDLMIYASL